MCRRHFFHLSLKYNPLNVCFAPLLREKQIVMIAWMMMMLASTVFCRFSRPPSLKWSRTKWKKEREREKKMFPRFSSKSDENHASPMENLARHQKLFFHNFPKPRATSAMNDAVVRRSYRSLILTTSQQQQYCWPDWKCLFLAYN